MKTQIDFSVKNVWYNQETEYIYETSPREFGCIITDFYRGMFYILKETLINSNDWVYLGKL